MNDTKISPDQDYTLYNTNQAQACDPSSSLALVSIREDRPLEPDTPVVPMTVFLVLILIAILLIVRTWKGRGSLAEKLFWSVFFFHPVFGPLFFLFFYPGRSELEARRWAAMSSVNRLGGGGGEGAVENDTRGWIAPGRGPGRAISYRAGAILELNPSGRDRVRLRGERFPPAER
jgi:hypothetical protein